MAHSLDTYRRMLTLRVTSEELVKLYLEQKIFSMVHFYIGQEAVATGVCDALLPTDKVVGNHRSHGHYLAKGGNVRRMICELLGRAEGAAHGKGGSMHMVDRSVNFVGSTPLLGSAAPLAAGVAFAEKFRKSGGVAVAFYGDGASEEGEVYETYNLAALYNLPLVLVVENNLFSINSKLRDRRSQRYNLESIAQGLGVQYQRADGNDYDDVHAKAVALIAGAREGKGPAVLECMTYRHMAHSTPLKEEKHREEDTEDRRLEHDSVARMRSLLQAEGVAEAELDAAETQIRESVHADIAYALSAPYPQKDALYTDVYA